MPINNYFYFLILFCKGAVLSTLLIDCLCHTNNLWEEDLLYEQFQKEDILQPWKILYCFLFFRTHLISVIFYRHTQNALCLVASDLVHLCIKSGILKVKKEKKTETKKENLFLFTLVASVACKKTIHRCLISTLVYCPWVYIAFLSIQSIILIKQKQKIRAGNPGCHEQTTP